MVETGKEKRPVILCWINALDLIQIINPAYGSLVIAACVTHLYIQNIEEQSAVSYQISAKIS